MKIIIDIPELEDPEEGGESLDQGTQEEAGEDGAKKRKPRRVFGLGKIL